jgi:hypothetical protein
MKLWPILAISIGCNGPAHDGVRGKQNQVHAEQEPGFQAVVSDANRRIVARQAAVKAWASVAIREDGKPCTRAPKVDVQVNGFRTGTATAKKTMVILSAAEIAGKPDPSLPPDVAGELAKIKAGGRGAPAPLGWATLDYTTDEFPFSPGPRAVAFQYGIGALELDGYTAAGLEQAKDELTRDELILVTEDRVRAEVNGESFRGGAMRGVALLWSYHDAAFVCAGRFTARSEAAEFSGSKGQVEQMPEEEVELRAFSNAAAGLREL